MSQEVFEIISKMDIKKLETQLVLQCAPVISGIKISNLLIVAKEYKRIVISILRKSEIEYYEMIENEGKITFLLYRKDMLESYLNINEIREYFIKQRYLCNGLENILRVFSFRYDDYMINKQTFPHEMGFLLGYPIEDVKGFIEHKGKDYIFSGYWKVYDREEEKRNLFMQYEDVTAMLLKQVSSGISIADIINKHNLKELQIAG